MPQEANGALPEELVVLFHASLLGRTDVVQSAIASIREKAASAGNGADNSYLSKEISVGRPDDDCTPLHVAALFGHADVVRSLLHAGASLTAYPQKGEYAGKRPYELAVESSRQAFHVYLFEQIAMGNVDVITKLLIGGVPVDIRDGSKTDDGTLHWAVSFGSTQVAKLLLSYGFQVLYLSYSRKIIAKIVSPKCHYHIHFFIAIKKCSHITIYVIIHSFIHKIGQSS